MFRTHRIAVIAGLFATTVVLSGCLFVGGKSIDETGTRVSRTTLNQVHEGQTTEAWLVATLGEPDHVTVVEDDPATRILRYDHTVEKSEGGAFLFLFATGNEERRTSRVFFEVQHGVVSRFWREGDR